MTSPLKDSLLKARNMGNAVLGRRFVKFYIILPSVVLCFLFLVSSNLSRGGSDEYTQQTISSSENTAHKNMLTRLPSGTVTVEQYEEPWVKLPYYGPSLPDDEELAASVSSMASRIKSKYFPNHDVCVTPSILHDPRPEMHKAYNEKCSWITNFWHDHYAFPVRVFPDGGYFAIHHETSINTRPSARYRYSAWTENNGQVEFADGPMYIKPPSLEQEVNDGKRSVITLTGTHAAFGSWFPDNFGHFLHDHLPAIAYLRHVVRSLSSYDTGVKMILFDTKVAREIMQLIDADFYQRIVWLQKNEVAQVLDGEMIVMHKHSIPSFGLVDYTRMWLCESKAMSDYRDVSMLRANGQMNHGASDNEKRYVIFYTRRSRDTEHGRALDEKHERDIIELIRQKMDQYNRPEELIIFNGIDEMTQQTMSVQQQFNLFRSASTAIGPHGSGMANVIWMDPLTNSCSERSQVLEFMTGPENKYKVHHTDSADEFVTTYSQVFWGIELEYHHILYTANSTNKATFVDMGNVEDALDVMWGPSRFGNDQFYSFGTHS